MKNKIIYCAAFAVVLLTAFTFLSGSVWTVNPAKIKISFDVPADPHQLSFTGIDASLVFDPADLAHSELIARVDVKSLVSEDPGLTKHLLSPDFFGAEKYPQIKFITTHIERLPEGAGYLAYGALAMKDSVHAITIPFIFDQKGDEGVFKGSFTIFCSDYGVMKKSKSGGDKVIISLEIAATRSKGQ